MGHITSLGDYYIGFPSPNYLFAMSGQTLEETYPSMPSAVHVQATFGSY